MGSSFIQYIPMLGLTVLKARILDIWGVYIQHTQGKNDNSTNLADSKVDCLIASRSCQGGCKFV